MRAAGAARGARSAPRGWPWSCSCSRSPCSRTACRPSRCWVPVGPALAAAGPAGRGGSAVFGSRTAAGGAGLGASCVGMDIAVGDRPPASGPPLGIAEPGHRRDGRADTTDGRSIGALRLVALRGSLLGASSPFALAAVVLGSVLSARHAPIALLGCDALGRGGRGASLRVLGDGALWPSCSAIVVGRRGGRRGGRVRFPRPAPAVPRPIPHTARRADQPSPPSTTAS